MSFKSLNQKIKKSFDIVMSNENNIRIKTSESKQVFKPSELHKIPNLLYDSGWINAGITQDNLTYASISLTYPNSTASHGQRLPFALSYNLKRTLDIPEAYLPFVKASILIKKYPEIDIEGVCAFQDYEYGDNYWKIYGDSYKIYEGTNIGARFFTETERINGDFLANNASKWYYGTLEYTGSGHSYEMRTSYIVSVKTYYDVTPLAGHPGYYSWKSFETEAIDGISSSAVSGEGTYVVNTAYESGGTPHNSTVTTKNVQMTAPMFEDRTRLYVSGTYYKDGVYQQVYQDTSPLLVDFQGTLGGTYTLSSFSYDWTTRQQWRLFWSNKRARWFRFNESTRVPITLPAKTYYETSTLPYTKIYVDENPTDYPEIEEDSTVTYAPSTEKQIFTKINDDRFVLRLIGSIYLSAPSRQESTTNVDFVEEEYSQDGDTYSRDSENRDDQEKPIYLPNGDNIQIRLLISFMNPISYNTVTNYKG